MSRRPHQGVSSQATSRKVRYRADRYVELTMNSEWMLLITATTAASVRTSRKTFGRITARGLSISATQSPSARAPCVISCPTEPGIGTTSC